MKNYDSLMSFEEKFKKCVEENNIEVKFNKKEIPKNAESFELIGHIVNMNPGYINLTYNEEKKICHFIIRKSSNFTKF